MTELTINWILLIIGIKLFLIYFWKNARDLKHENDDIYERELNNNISTL